MEGWPRKKKEPLPKWVHEDEAPENEDVEVKKLVRRYLRKVYVDLLGPTVESYDFFSGCGTTRDADCNWPEFAPLKDKAPESVGAGAVVHFVSRHGAGPVGA